jgi:hypothetical protein
VNPRRTPRAPAAPVRREGAGASGPGQSGVGAAARAVAPAPAARRIPGANPGLQDLIDQLGRDVQQMRIDFERFFSGALLFPPDELRARIQAQLRSLRNSNLATAVDSFRVTDMEARFNSYNELYSRRVREREEGRQRAVHPPPPPAEEPRHDPRRGITVGTAGEVGRRLDPAAVAALYDGLASGPGEGPRFDLASFGSYLERQAAAIHQKTGCTAVQFRLAEEDGKLKLKARPIAGAQAPR